jgi:DNA-binding helix-hairpin-helix protein with protein kinase domain
MSEVIKLTFDLPDKDGTTNNVATTLDRLGVPVKCGGVADIYLYSADDHRRFVVKKFKEPHNVPWDKLKYLQRKYQAAATSVPSDGEMPFIAWPVSLVYQDNSVALDGGSLINQTPVGFTMLYLDPAEWPSFDNWIEPNLRRKLSERLDSLSYRLWILINCAKALGHLHAEGAAMVDVKPDNICVNFKTLQVALLDVDSYRITGDAKVYPGTHWFPGYILPSALNNDDVDKILASLGVDQDRYCLAVLIFEFLNYGIHPFQGIPLTDDDDNSQDGNARRHRYAYGVTPSPDIRPTPTSVHECWPVGLRRMFERAFSPSGSVSPSEWADYFTAFIGELKECDQQRDNVRHIRFAECGCMACTRAQASERFELVQRTAEELRKQAQGPTPLVDTPPTGSTPVPQTGAGTGSHAGSTTGSKTGAATGQGNSGAFFGWVAVWILYAAVSHWYYGTPWNDLWPIKVFVGSPPPRSSLSFPITEPKFSPSNPTKPFLNPDKLFFKPSNPVLNQTQPTYSLPKIETGK